MSKLLRDILIILAIFVVISIVFSGFSLNGKETVNVTISELVKQINDGQVKEIAVNDQNLEITLSDNSKEESRKETEASLSESLANYGVDAEKLAAVDIAIKEPSDLTLVLTAVLPFLLPLLLIGVFFWFMFRQAQKGTTQAFSFIRSQARVASLKEKVTFEDVAGLEQAKEEFKEIVEFLKNPRKFLNMGARIPRGVLMVGAPGTGKTLLARAVAGEANVPFFHMSGSEFVEMFVGVGASRVRDLFNNAKRNSPSIIFIDEIDAVGRHRGAGLGGGHDEREQTLNQILVEMDGFDRETNIMILAATNRPDILDPALLRPGRFDRRVVLDMPDIKEREAILKIHSKGKPLGKNINLKKIAERTPGFSGADLANVINESAILAARHNKKEVDQLDLIQSIEKVLLGPERKSHILSTKEKEIAAYHEAGHAVIAASMPHADPVHKVSIVSRGQAAGFTLKLPTEDKHLHSKSEFLADLAVMMGGYAAEKLVFKELTTGASNDLETATELARQLVTRFGMSEKIGPVAFGRREELVFLGKEMTEHRNYSEEIASLIDHEVKSLIDSAYKTATNIIKSGRKKLNKVAKVLIEKETIEQDEFAKLMARA